MGDDDTSDDNLNGDVIAAIFVVGFALYFAVANVLQWNAQGTRRRPLERRVAHKNTIEWWWRQKYVSNGSFAFRL